VSVTLAQETVTETHWRKFFKSY